MGRQRRQPQLPQKLIVPISCLRRPLLYLKELFVYFPEVDLFFRLRRADISGDVQVVIVSLNFLYGYAAGIAFFFFAMLVGVDDFIDVFGQQCILPLSLFEVLAGIDEKDVFVLFALFQDQDAYTAQNQPLSRPLACPAASSNSGKLAPLSHAPGKTLLLFARFSPVCAPALSICPGFLTACLPLFLSLVRSQI
jgi:hypothetical protein